MMRVKRGARETESIERKGNRRVVEEAAYEGSSAAGPVEMVKGGTYVPIACESEQQLERRETTEVGEENRAKSACCSRYA